MTSRPVYRRMGLDGRGGIAAEKRKTFGPRAREKEDAMLKNWTPPKQKDKQDIKAELKALRERLLGLQQPLRDRGLPVIVLVEGWAAAGKGSLINELIREIDPRFFGVVSPVLPPETEDRYPFLYQYAREIPENGKIMFYDSGWMEGAVRRYLRREITERSSGPMSGLLPSLSVSCGTAGILLLNCSCTLTRESSGTGSAL